MFQKKNLLGLCLFSFIIIFISMKTNSVLTCWNLEKSIGWRTLITFQMNGKAFLKRMLKNRMNIRWCFINVYARTRYPKILKLPNNKICVKLTPWAPRLSRPTKNDLLDHKWKKFILARGITYLNCFKLIPWSEV